MTSPFELREYLVRRKVLKVLGASFHIYDPDGRVIGYTNQKAFKLKEDIRVYADEGKQMELLTIAARQVIDFAASYDIVDAQEGIKVGAARRRGFKSIVRDSWELLDENDEVIAQVQEDSTAMALARRFLSNLIPQRFEIKPPQGAPVQLRQHFNPFVYRLAVNIPDSCPIDHRLIFGVVSLIAAIEGRQN